MIVTGRQQLAEALDARISGIAEASVAVVFVSGGVLTADDVIAIREAARVCDVAVVISMEKPLPRPFAKIAEEAGAQIIYIHKPKPNVGAGCTVKQKGGADITLYLEALLLIMPSAVVVANENLNTLRIIKALEATFNGFFSIIETTTPAAILSQRQQDLTATLMFAQDVLDQGERRPQVVLQQVVDALEQNGFSTVQNLMLLDAESLAEVQATVPKHSFLFADITEGEQTLRRSVKLSA